MGDNKRLGWLFPKPEPSVRFGALQAASYSLAHLGYDFRGLNRLRNLKMIMDVTHTSDLWLQVILNGPLFQTGC